nr:hypothetical protein CFP56_30486 [Quercus suber]
MTVMCKIAGNWEPCVETGNLELKYLRASCKGVVKVLILVEEDFLKGIHVVIIAILEFCESSGVFESFEEGGVLSPLSTTNKAFDDEFVMRINIRDVLDKGFLDIGRGGLSGLTRALSFDEVPRVSNTIHEKRKIWALKLITLVVSSRLSNHPISSLSRNPHLPLARTLISISRQCLISPSSRLSDRLISLSLEPSSLSRARFQARKCPVPNQAALSPLMCSFKLHCINEFFLLAFVNMFVEVIGLMLDHYVCNGKWPSISPDYFSKHVNKCRGVPNAVPIPNAGKGHPLIIEMDKKDKKKERAKEKKLKNSIENAERKQRARTAAAEAKGKIDVKGIERQEQYRADKTNRCRHPASLLLLADGADVGDRNVKGHPTPVWCSRWSCKSLTDGGRTKPILAPIVSGAPFS